MKKTIIVSIFSLAAILFTACSGGTSTGQNKDSTASAPSLDSAGKMMAGVKYTCKMHPEVISDTPGHCPKCGMELVPITDSTHMSKDSIVK